MYNGDSYRVSIPWKAKSQEESNKLFSTHSYLRVGPNFRTNTILTMEWWPDGYSIPLYHISMGSHQPSWGIKQDNDTRGPARLPLDQEIPYRTDGYSCIMLSRLVSALGETSLRDTFSVSKGKPLSAIKARLLEAGIAYAFQKLNAGLVIDYIDKTNVQLVDEAKNLVDRVCVGRLPYRKLQDTGKFYATYWTLGVYMR